MLLIAHILLSLTVKMPCGAVTCPGKKVSTTETRPDAKKGQLLINTGLRLNTCYSLIYLCNDYKITKIEPSPNWLELVENFLL